MLLVRSFQSSRNGNDALKANPQNLDTLEREVQQEFLRGAGLVVAGLIAVVMQTKEFAADVERVRQNYSVLLAEGRERTMSIPLLGVVNDVHGDRQGHQTRR